MDSIEITVMRTASATALAAKYLSRTDSRTLTICGCGVQASAQGAALADVRDFERGFAWDVYRDRAETFASEMTGKLGFPFEVPQSLGDATRASDVIVTCTTASDPFLDEGMVSPGTFVAAVGADAPGKNEIAPGLMAKSSVFADVTEQAVVMGDLHHAISAGAMTAGQVRGELVDLVSSRVAGRGDEDEIVLFDSTGTAIEDVASAAVAYERALNGDIMAVGLTR
jgi:alanine dehydrogenase